MATYIIYPERKYAPDTTIIMWAHDAVANDEVGEEYHEGIAKDELPTCIAALNDAGVITTGRPR